MFLSARESLEGAICGPLCSRLRGPALAGALRALTVPDDQRPGAGGPRGLAGLRAGEVWRSADPGGHRGGHGGPLGGEETGWLGAVLKRYRQTFSPSATDAAAVTPACCTAPQLTMNDKAFLFSLILLMALLTYTKSKLYSPVLHNTSLLSDGLTKDPYLTVVHSIHQENVQSLWRTKRLASISLEAKRCLQDVYRPD